MMHITTPATKMDMARAMGQRNPVYSAYGWDQMAAGESWSLRTDAGELVGVGGIALLPGDECPQIWLMLAREVAQKQMLLVVRAIRLTLEAAAYDDLECRVMTKAGGRIAALCGFEFFESPSPYSMEIWKYAITDHAQTGQEHVQAGGGAGQGGGGAATGVNGAGCSKG